MLKKTFRDWIPEAEPWFGELRQCNDLSSAGCKNDRGDTEDLKAIRQTCTEKPHLSSWKKHRMLFCGRTPVAIREAKPMTELQPEMEEKAQEGAEEPREVVWPFLFSPSISAAPDLSGEAAHSLSCSLEPAGRSFQDWFCNHLQNQPTWRQKNNTPHPFPKKAIIIIVWSCSPNTPNDWK